MEISDEVVSAAIYAAEGYSNATRIGFESMRQALQAAIPLVVEGLVGSPNDFLKHIDDGYPRGFREGSNARRQDILAKVKK